MPLHPKALVKNRQMFSKNSSEIVTVRQISRQNRQRPPEINKPSRQPVERRQQMMSKRAEPKTKLVTKPRSSLIANRLPQRRRNRGLSELRETQIHTTWTLTSSSHTDLGPRAKARSKHWTSQFTVNVTYVISWVKQRTIPSRDSSTVYDNNLLQYIESYAKILYIYKLYTLLSKLCTQILSLFKIRLNDPVKLYNFGEV